MNKQYKIFTLNGKTATSKKTMIEAAGYISGIKTYKKTSDSFSKMVIFKDVDGKIIGRIWRQKTKPGCTVSINVENYKG